MRAVNTNAVIMALFWSIVLIGAVHFIRRHGAGRASRMTLVLSLGIVAAIRLLLAVDAPWSVPVGLPAIYNPLELWLRTTVVRTGGGEITIRLLLRAIWAAGAVIFLARYVLIYYLTATRLRKSLIPDGGLAEKLARVRENEDEKRRREVLIGRSRQVDTPVSIGLMRCMIVIPERAFSDTEQELMVRHEYTHLKNGDLCVKAFLNIVCCLFWWFVPVYLLRKDVEQAMEIRCDADVTKGMDGNGKADYLEMLLDVFQGNTRSVPRSMTLNVIGSTMAADIRERFDLLSHEGGRQRKYQPLAIGALMIALLVASYTVIVQPAFAVPIEEIEDGPDAFEITTDNTVIVHYSDDTWALRVNGIENPVSAEGARIFIDEPPDEGEFELLEIDASEKPLY